MWRVWVDRGRGGQQWSNGDDCGDGYGVGQTGGGLEKKLDAGVQLALSRRRWCFAFHQAWATGISGGRGIWKVLCGAQTCNSEAWYSLPLCVLIYIIKWGESMGKGARGQFAGELFGALNVLLQVVDVCLQVVVLPPFSLFLLFFFFENFQTKFDFLQGQRLQGTGGASSEKIYFERERDQST